MGNHTIKIFIAFLLFSVPLLAQQLEASDTTSLKEPRLLRNSGDSVYVMHKSPWGAVLRSAVIPGLGQVYNKSYWKVPVVWGFIGFYSYYWIDYNKNYKKWLVNPDPRRYSEADKIQMRNFYRDQRDLFAIYIGIVYALNLLDAYVDAQLFDFSVDEDPVSKASRLSVKLHF